jgi:hypothetical protein
MALVSYLIAVSNRQVDAIYGDEPLELVAVYAFLAMGAISFGAFLVAEVWAVGGDARTAPRHFVGEDDRDPGEVRTSVRDGEMKRIGGEY